MDIQKLNLTLADIEVQLLHRLSLAEAAEIPILWVSANICA